MDGTKASEEDIVTRDLSIKLFDAMIARLPLLVDVTLLPPAAR